MNPIKIPHYWSAEQATAVFEFVDNIREQILAHYLLQIREYVRDERCAEFEPDYDPDFFIDDDELPF